MNLGSRDLAICPLRWGGSSNGSDRGTRRRDADDEGGEGDEGDEGDKVGEWGKGDEVSEAGGGRWRKGFRFQDILWEIVRGP